MNLGSRAAELECLVVRIQISENKSAHAIFGLPSLSLHESVPTNGGLSQGRLKVKPRWNPQPRGNRVVDATTRFEIAGIWSLR